MTVEFTALRQARRPQGRPTPEDFRTYQGTTPELETGQILVANSHLSVDPYHREAMEFDDWAEGFGLEGRCLGTVIESRDSAFPEGATVFHRHGWATHAVLDTQKNKPRIVKPAQGVPLSAYLGVLGGTGMSAYVGKMLVRL